ncbi:MAG: hypothetical protein KY475_16615, partial [Planctomycetes bacterium]|nr:hypothetical protein [Planctomycetota bacterium]
AESSTPQNAGEPAGASLRSTASHPGADTNRHANGKSGNGSIDAALLHRAGVAYLGETAGVQERSHQFASFQSDAPACDNCGAITVRNGNCYLCYNCGNSMGCS